MLILDVVVVLGYRVSQWSSPGHLPSPKWSKLYVDMELMQCYTFHTALTLI